MSFGKLLFYEGKIALLLKWAEKNNEFPRYNVSPIVSTRLTESFRKSLEEMSKQGEDAEEGHSPPRAPPNSPIKIRKKLDLPLLHDVCSVRVEHGLV